MELFKGILSFVASLVDRDRNFSGLGLYRSRGTRAPSGVNNLGGSLYPTSRLVPPFNNVQSWAEIRCIDSIHSLTQLN